LFKKRNVTIFLLLQSTAVVWPFIIFGDGSALVLINTRLISFVIIRIMRTVGRLKAWVTAVQTLPRTVMLLIMSHGKFKVYQTGLTVSMRLSSDTCRLLVNVNGYNRDSKT